MIEFECPRCGSPLEVKDHMANREVDCPDCEEPIQVPRRSQPPSRRGGRGKEPSDAGLSGKEYLFFILIFLIFPAGNVLVSSVLYYVWKKDQPRRAKQINNLGFIIFAIHLVCYVLYLNLVGKP